ncbi:MAG TPA: peptidylprolyl isomerase [Luteolibacter sp.]|nr:peptidylprolyl isomerase [Luteolibacter sp.]
MKTAVILAMLALPAAAQITATFEIIETASGTPLGEVEVELQYDKTPQTVANFITLAEGTRSSYDPATGAVRPKKFYAGESFYRVLNDTGFKIAQTGSGNGTNSGGPGYMFRDEILLPTLKHDPYVLAMANAGPNTNGSQIYFTGSDSIASLDGKHTVFGRVTATASQGVIDEIIAAGNDGTTITDVTIQRNGAEAEAFDEHAWNLPTCQAIPGSLSVDISAGFRDVSYICDIPLPEASLFKVSGSLDLQSWGPPGQFSPTIDFPAGTRIGIDQTMQARKFYNISLTAFPNPIYQPGLPDRILVLSFSGGDTITFTFDETGAAGNMTLSWQSGQNYPFTSDYNAEAYGGAFVAFPVQAWPFSLPLDVRCGFDSETVTEVSGRHTTSLTNGQGLGSGSLTLSK